MPTELHIYNSLTRKKEIFKPINPPNVGLYVCGPTVYNEVHLGNVRTFITFDVVYRYLKHLNYKVRYVRNLTDVGHLTEDDNEEDKVLKRAKLENLEPMEIAQKYTNNFHEVMRLFNNQNPDIEPIATGHIIEQIEMVQQIINKGYAYEVNGSVYFNVIKYNEDHPYGTLSGRKIEDLIDSGRDLDSQDEKLNKVDFALWKKATKGHIMKWSSPWGEGFPGWHLECSVMSTKYLGQTFDIHGGGMDLKFPHHECEIAQNVGSVGTSPVNYWMHGNMLNFEGQKMSKSKGNSILPAELISGNHPLLEKGYSPMVVRLFFLSSHYSSEVDISNKALQDAEKNYRKLCLALKGLDTLTCIEGPLDDNLENQVNTLCNQCIEEMNDDFNTATTLSKMYALSSIINTFLNNKKQVLGISLNTFERLKSIFSNFFFEVFGLQTDNSDNSATLDNVMDILIKIRENARANKDWTTSDLIRDQLKTANIVLNDGKDGTTYEILD